MTSEYSKTSELAGGLPPRAHGQAREYFLCQLRAAPLTTVPWPHIHLASALPMDYFQEMLRRLPRRRHYRRARGWKHTQDCCDDILGRRGRKYELWIEHLTKGQPSERHPEDALLRGFWAKFHRWLACDAVLRALAESCAVEAKRPLRASVRLVREEEAIYLAPHLDRPFKLLTLLFYLTQGSERSAQGTTFYRRSEDGSLIKIRTTPFEPNSALIMLCTPDSWHGVEPHLHQGQRDTLHLYLREDERELAHQVRSSAATVADPRTI